jgi:hypothetical protein
MAGGFRSVQREFRLLRQLREVRDQTTWTPRSLPIRVESAAGAVAVGRGSRCCSISRVLSKREPGIAFEDAPLEARPLARAPHRHAVDDAIAERPSVRARAAFERPRDAHELAFDGVCRQVQRRIAVAAHIEEGDVRRQVRVRRAPRALGIPPRRRLRRTGRGARPSASASAWIEAPRRPTSHPSRPRRR